MKKVLILGVNGFIGSSLTEAILKQTDWEVYGLDVGDHKLEGCLHDKRFRFVEGDVMISREWIEYHVQKCDVVVPLVAIANPAQYVKDPLRVFELDFESNLAVVRQCAKYKKRIIFPSTSEVYGMCADPVLNEDSSPMVYGPTVLFALGEGAVIPLIPVIAAQLGAGVATAALVASALVVGQLCGNIPAGWAVARIGERLTMAVAGFISLAGVAGMALAPSLGLLAISVFLIGFCAAAFGLARHSFMTTRVPLAFRARALSLLGGTFRLGMFIGPFVAAALLVLFGDEHATIWFFGVCLVATVLLVLLGPDPERQFAPAVTRPSQARPGPDFAEDTGEPVTGSLPPWTTTATWSASRAAPARCAPRSTVPPSTRTAVCGSPPPWASTATSPARPAGCSRWAWTAWSSTPRTGTRSG